MTRSFITKEGYEKRGHESIIELYEKILDQGGIHIKQTKLGFDTCYKRYKTLGGRKDYTWGESNARRMPPMWE